MSDFDIDALMTQIITGFAQNASSEDSKKLMIHSRDCAECRDRLAVTMEKGINQLFQQEFFQKMLKEWSDRLQSHADVKYDIMGEL